MSGGNCSKTDQVAGNPRAVSCDQRGRARQPEVQTAATCTGGPGAVVHYLVQIPDGLSRREIDDVTDGNI